MLIVAIFVRNIFQFFCVLLSFLQKKARSDIKLHITPLRLFTLRLHFTQFKFAVFRVKMLRKKTLKIVFKEF